MEKKDIKKASAGGAGILGSIAQSGEHQAAPDPPAAQPKKKTAYYGDRADIYRFSLNMPVEFEAYLKKAAYDASEPGRAISINRYICDLIQYDIDRGGVIDYHKGAQHGKE